MILSKGSVDHEGSPHCKDRSVAGQRPCPEPRLEAASRRPRFCSHKMLGPARVCAWGVRAPGWVEKEMTARSSTLTWDISWTEGAWRAGGHDFSN